MLHNLTGFFAFFVESGEKKGSDPVLIPTLAVRTVPAIGVET